MQAHALDLYEIQRRLGGQVYAGGTRWLGPGPNHSRRDLSLSVRLDGDRPLIHSFANDPFPRCLEHLGIDRAAMDRGPDRSEWIKRQRERENLEREDRARKEAFCAHVWGGAVTAAGSPVEVYLRQARGLPVTPPATFRFHPDCPLAYPWSEAAQEGRAGRSPAMVALVVQADGRGTGLHVTPITAAGERAKRNKLMFGHCIEGAVRLSDMGDDGRLGVTEGIETGFAFGLLHGVPVWATLSTAGLKRFRVPDRVRSLTIGADSDDKGAGIEAAKELAERASRRADCLVVAAPDGKDWADVWEARQ